MKAAATVETAATTMSTPTATSECRGCDPKCYCQTGNAY